MLHSLDVITLDVLVRFLVKDILIGPVLLGNPRAMQKNQLTNQSNLIKLVSIGNLVKAYEKDEKLFKQEQCYFKTC